MDKLFPSMCSKPEKGKIIAIIPCWFWVFVLFPMFMPFLGLGLWEQWELSAWLEIGYHVANAILLLFVMGSYLKDEWFMVSTDIRYYLKHVAITVGLMAGTELAILRALSLFGVDIGYMLEGLPIVEMFVSHTPLFFNYFAAHLRYHRPLDFCTGQYLPSVLLSRLCTNMLQKNLAGLCVHCSNYTDTAYYQYSMAWPGRICAEYLFHTSAPASAGLLVLSKDR